MSGGFPRFGMIGGLIIRLCFQGWLPRRLAFHFSKGTLR